jgi:hypothetical protein
VFAVVIVLVFAEEQDGAGFDHGPRWDGLASWR